MRELGSDRGIKTNIVGLNISPHFDLNSIILCLGITMPHWAFRVNQGRQLLGSRKKMGSIAPKLGPYRRNQNFRKNVENRDSGEMAHFQEF